MSSHKAHPGSGAHPEPATRPDPETHLDPGSNVAQSLARVFGYRAFRPNQREIVEAVLARRDAFVVMPTGGGKSLCYQLPAVMLPGTAVVVSPLIALMKDQVDASQANGVRAAFLNSTLEAAERSRTLARLRAGELDLLYVAPERFADPGFAAMLEQVSPSFFAIDEAHCISEWGHEFRPDYLRLGELAGRFPTVPIAAFTATATHAVQRDILARLGLRSPLLVRASFDRPNLRYSVLPKSDERRQIRDFVTARSGDAGIVYRASRKSVEQTAADLQQAGIKALPYHAGLDDATRAMHQEAFSRDEVDVVVATIAFGMGIDKSNVRWVLHADLPKSLESYYQESGRAGRDGEPADCTLLYAARDIQTARFFVNQIEAPEQRDNANRALKAMVRYASSLACRREQILRYFGDQAAAAGVAGADSHGAEPLAASRATDAADTRTNACCDVCAGEVHGVDATRDAQIVMSAIVRLGQRFGAGHVIDVVRGANTVRIRELGHAGVRTYGAGAELPVKHWRRVVDALISAGMVEQTDDRYPVLKLRETARPVLRGEVTFQMPAHARPLVRRAATAELSDGDAELFQQLRRLRKEIASRHGIPAYVVFADRTLRELAQVRPHDVTAMADIHGVGSEKLSRYGDEFLACIREYAALH